ncbi:MAG: TIR domain-containing protein [Bacteroidota bacterium]|nr:TIR domain-containing protein [Bacteroidota bacterium]MDE2645105.1 TIR domain-containing protein [Bacteroidota bacterium]
MSVRIFNLFISHSWSYATNYEQLIALLRNRSYFLFRDYSVPHNDPIHNANTVAELREAIRLKMSSCGVILILAGVYATYSRWINEEIGLAKGGFSSPKPIIAIRPRGNERLSTNVQNASDKIVNWNTDSVVGAIRELG